MLGHTLLCVCGIGVNNAGTYPTVCVWYRGEQCWDIPYCVCGIGVNNAGTYPTVCGTRPGQLGCQHHHRGIECIDIRHVWYRGEQCRDIPYCVCGIGVNNAGTYPTVCVELDLASLAVNTIIEV